MSNSDHEPGTLHEVGPGIYAYVQDDGSWGFSNAGLIADGGQAVLIDTLFDVPRTRAMLGAMRRANAAARHIDVVVNTHANGDHTWGNQLVADARIIASSACARELADMPPVMLQQMLNAAPTMGLLGRYIQAIFGRFDFHGITLTPPTETFDGRMDLAVGDKPIQLIEVGPAHTRGDILAYVPGDRVVFTGDIVFNGGHPVIWAGPVDNWIRACRTILDMDVDVVVPGHGELAEKSHVRALADYLQALYDGCAARYQAGVPLEQAVREIAAESYATSRTEAERVYINVCAVYRELGADAPADVINLFQGMAGMARSLGLYGLS